MSLANSPPPKRFQRGLLSSSFALAAYSAEDPEGPDSAPDVLSSGAGGSDKPSLAYLRDHAVRLAGGLRCPNCGRELKASESISIALAAFCAATAATAMSRPSNGGGDANGGRRA